MSNVLVLAEQSRGTLRKATLSAVTAARELAHRTGGKVTALVLGCGAGAAADELAAHGVTVRLADAPALAHPLAEAHAPVVAEAAKVVGASWVVAPATAYGKDVLPRAAVALGAAVATEVLAIAGAGAEILLRRPMWAGNVIAEVELRTEVKAFTVRPTEFPPAGRAPGGSVAPLPVTVDAATLRTRWVGLEEVKSERPELTDARVVVAGGRGTKGDFGPITGLADVLGGAVGASRAAVDAGWAPNDWQVGQTGKVVAPELYVAAGISGAIQHVAGMKGAKVIVAVNKDADAPIFQIADYGLVADLFQALPELRDRVQGA
ncbi:MAG TPA: FAD-binding protein [Anaeromyxobacter sp.]|nr:FAD-binding protein [Anaeromyxobacter sp.]